MKATIQIEDDNGTWEDMLILEASDKQLQWDKLAELSKKLGKRIRIVDSEGNAWGVIDGSTSRAPDKAARQAVYEPAKGERSPLRPRAC